MAFHCSADGPTLSLLGHGALQMEQCVTNEVCCSCEALWCTWLKCLRVTVVVDEQLWTPLHPSIMHTGKSQFLVGGSKGIAGRTEWSG